MSWREEKKGKGDCSRQKGKGVCRCGRTNPSGPGATE